MTHAEWVSHVAGRAGLPRREEAERTLRLVLEALGEGLPWSELQALAEDLPAPLAEALRGVAHGQAFEREELYARVAQREGVRPGFAVEHTGVVCQVLAEGLPPATLHRLREALPESIAALLQPPQAEASFPPAHVDPRHHTLAEGRPGSRHPLSEARPGRTHSHSVVREDNPHGDTKLSSARGLTQEREAETLATGHPGSSRPLSGE